MKWFKALLIIALLGFTVTALAQNRRGGNGRGEMSAEDMAKRQTERMKTELNLTAEQEVKIQAINMKYAEQQVAKRDEKKEKRREMETAQQAVMDQKDAEIKALLTPEQLTKYEKYCKQEKKEQKKEHKKERKRQKRETKEMDD